MIQSQRGVYDILPETVSEWQYVEGQLRAIAESYNFKELRTPMFEATELFSRGVGDDSDIVSKEMYTFSDKGGRSITLRPEFTAAVVRSYIQHKRYGDPIQPQKFFYYGPLFRYERAQKGRYRQFHQFGVEVFGPRHPMTDAELIVMAKDMFTSFGIPTRLHINTLGNEESRMAYSRALQEHFTPHIETMCHDCQERIMKNPLRILDCKVDAQHEAMDNVPQIESYLDEASTTYFQEVCTYLDEASISYHVDPSLVRGLDYYTDTVFELVLDTKEGFGLALCGGGRYDTLVSTLDGPETKAAGFAVGMDRLLLVLKDLGIELPVEDTLDAYFITTNEASTKVAFQKASQLRLRGLRVELPHLQKSMKAQLKDATRQGAVFAIILGEDELERSVAYLKHLETSVQYEVPLDELVTALTEFEDTHEHGE